MRVVTLEPSPHPLDDADAVADYLDNGVVVWAAASRRLAQECGPGCTPVTVGVASDGVVAWPLDAGHRVRAHGAHPEAVLLDRIRQRGYDLPVVRSEDVAHLREELAGGEHGDTPRPEARDGAHGPFD